MPLEDEERRSQHTANDYYRILQTHHARTHTSTHAFTHTPPPSLRVSLFDGSLASERDGVNALFAGSASDQWPVAGSFKRLREGQVNSSVVTKLLRYPYFAGRFRPNEST